MKKRKVNQSLSTLVMVAVGVVCAAGILSWELGWEKSVWKEKLDPQPVDIYLSKDGTNGKFMMIQPAAGGRYERNGRDRLQL